MSQIIPPPLSLYIHFPWCVKKCPYCDFNSHKLKTDFNESQYIDALITDLEQDVTLVWGRPVSTIFMGGGTPSLFSAAAIERLLNAIRALLPCKPDMEITMEVNPGTGEYDNFVGYKQAGVNRLSIGVQSLHNDNLQALGRIHSAKQAIAVYQHARDAGFNNINLDMMFALPNQSLKAAKQDLLQLIDLQPNHISYYQLTIEANTLFAVKTPNHLPSNDNLATMYTQGNNLLEANDYSQYEVSAYAKTGDYCQHNVNYWQFGDYLGIGAGAHSKLSCADSNTIRRYVKYKSPKKYLLQNRNFVQEMRHLNGQDLMFEFMLNAVRYKKRINFSDFTLRTGLELSRLLKKMKLAETLKLVKIHANALEVTPKGYLFSDDIVKVLL